MKMTFLIQLISLSLMLAACGQTSATSSTATFRHPDRQTYQPAPSVKDKLAAVSCVIFVEDEQRVGIPEEGGASGSTGNLLVGVKEEAQFEYCIHQIRVSLPNLKVLSLLPETKIMAVAGALANSPRKLADRLQDLSCTVAVEAEGIIGIPEDMLVSRTTGNFLVTMADHFPVDMCAEQIAIQARPEAELIELLETVGIAVVGPRR